MTPTTRGLRAVGRGQRWTAPTADDAAATAKLEPNVLANIRSCDKTWCRVNGPGFDGFVKQVDLWGVYPNEVIE